MSDKPEERPTGPSRRNLLGAGLAAGGVVAAAAAEAAAPRAPSGPPANGLRNPAPESGPSPEPTVRIYKTFRALIRRPNEPRARIETVKLLPFGGRQVLVRSTANQCCYSLTPTMLEPNLPPGRMFPAITGHAGLGVVEAIGPEVRLVKPGDKVFIAGTAQCNTCYNCARGRSDACLANNLSAGPVAVTEDGMPIGQTAGIGGLAEYVVNYEERLVPYVSDLSDEIVSMLPDACGTGLGMTNALRQIEAGSTVVVIGCGPIGLSAIQGCKIQGASRIIAVEPIKIRRDMALKMGAHEVIDPNQWETPKLLEHLQAITTAGGHPDRMFFGDRHPIMRGPDYVLEAVGHQHFTPKVEQPKDPSGVEAFELAVNLVSWGGYGMLAGGYDPTDRARLAPNGMTILRKTLIACQNGGMQTRRDLPRYLRLVENGQFDVKSLITKIYSFDEVMQAFQDVADRTVIGAVVKF